MDDQNQPQQKQKASLSKALFIFICIDALILLGVLYFFLEWQAAKEEEAARSQHTQASATRQEPATTDPDGEGASVQQDQTGSELSSSEEFTQGLEQRLEQVAETSLPVPDLGDDGDQGASGSEQ